MTDLISRQDAIEAIVNSESKVAYHDASETVLYGSAFRQNEIIDILSTLPSADAVEVVRCKDCIHYESDGGALMVCRIDDMVVDDTDYCSYGERREP